MKKFIILYQSPADAIEQSAQLSPEQQAKGMEAWMHWAEKCGDKLIDLGSPLMPGHALNAKGAVNNSMNTISGYSILQAESSDELMNLLEGHPHLNWNSEASIEIHEAMSMPVLN